MRFGLRLLLLLVGSFAFANNFDVVVIGDDISVDTASASNWISRLKRKTSCKLQIYNSSTYGVTSKDGHSILKRFLNSHKTKVAVIELGINDVKKKESITRLEKNLEEIILLSKKYNTNVIILGIELPPKYGTFQRQMLKSTYERVANRHGVSLVMSQYASNPNLVKEDKMSPNEDGHEVLSQTISPRINELVCR